MTVFQPESTQIAGAKKEFPASQVYERSSLMESRYQHTCLACFSVDLGTLSSKDIIILVMGPPGVGKSTFINNVTNSEPESPVGHGLNPEIIKIQAFRVIRNNRSFVFIDTLGFNDANSKVITEQAILNLVLIKVSKSKVKLACIVYLHQISDNRLTFHKARENSALFENLLEKGATGRLPYEKILLATTMWRDEHDDAKYQAKLRREVGLQAQYWHGVVHSGQNILRFYDTINSAWELIKSVDGLVV